MASQLSPRAGLSPVGRSAGRLARLYPNLLPEYAPYAECYLICNTLELFGVTRSEVLALWRSHPQGALALAYHLLLNGSVPPEWPRAEVMGWLEEACLAATDADEAQGLSDALLMLEHLPQSPGG